MARAVFLDRDGVLIDDVDLLTDVASIRIQPGAPEALLRLRKAGFRLVVVSNQTVVSRGLVSEEGVRQIEREIELRLQAAGAPRLDGFYFCPHHPSASIDAYRVPCACRKPRPGMLLAARDDLGIDLSSSFLVGDRMTDVRAGASVGCRTILIETGRHLAPPIETADPADGTVRPEHICADLRAAADWIVGLKA